MVDGVESESDSGLLSRIRNLPQRIRKAFARRRISPDEAGDFLYDRLIFNNFLRDTVGLRKEIKRSSQWIAALTLPLVIPITVNLIVAMSLVMEGILSAFGNASEALFFQFLITGLNLAFISLAFYFWILWVATGGLGLFSYEP